METYYAYQDQLSASPRDVDPSWQTEHGKGHGYHDRAHGESSDFFWLVPTSRADQADTASALKSTPQHLIL
jgi:hypothetical protein